MTGPRNIASQLTGFSQFFNHIFYRAVVMLACSHHRF